MRDADAALPPNERRHRTLSQDKFRRLCDLEGGVSSPEHLLDYLANAGIVFHRKGLFEDRVVLDQAWALDAIYAVFQRERCYRQLRHLHGRFTRDLLEALVWWEYGVAEQRLFLSMMLSCGICFIHRGAEPDGDEDEYIAPDLLPERATVQAELDEKWDPELPSEVVILEYPLLHSGLIRAVIARVGGESAGANALYWRGAAYTSTNARPAAAP